MANFEKREGNFVHFTMEVPSEVFSKAIQQAYLKNKKDLSIPGFRKGKVPRQIIERHYGKDIFYQDALDIAIPDLFEQAVNEMDIIPVDYPSFDIEGEIEKNKPVILKGKVEVPPEIELKKYKGLEVEKIEYNVTDKNIDDEIENARNKNARIIEVERSVKEGDILTIDYEGFMDNEPFEGGTAQDQTLEIGSGHFIPGFEEGLIGKNKFDTVDLDLKFPEVYHAKDLAGKPVKFVVTIQEIKEKQLPDFDDEFVKDVSEFDTVDEYKDSIRKTLEEQFENKRKADTENLLLKALVEENDFEVPPSMLRNQVNEELNNFAYQMQSQGINFKDYLQYTGSNIETLKMQVEPMAKMRVKEELILNTIAKVEGIEATEEDIEKELEKATSFLKEEDKKEYKEKMLEKNKHAYESRIKLRKALQLIEDSAIYKEKEEKESEDK